MYDLLNIKENTRKMDGMSFLLQEYFLRLAYTIYDIYNMKMWAYLIRCPI